MDILRQLEITFILWLQSLGDWLAGPMQGISLFGNEEFYLLVMPAIYWCMDATLGLRSGIMLMLTNGLSTVFKLVFHTPRPYWFDTRVQAHSTETTFGLPSGHAQHAASLWGLIATAVPGKYAKWFFGVLIFLIGLSRIYLGVHFISDVLLGWAIGGLLLWVYLKVEKSVWERVRGRSLAHMLGLSLAASVFIMLLILASAAALGGYETPVEWEQNALSAAPGNIIEPLDVSGAFTVSGTLLGLLAGAAWMYHKRGGFDVSGTPMQRILRYWVGLVGVFACWYGLKMIFPDNDDALSYALRFFRYVLVGLWVTALAPLVFERIGLSAAPKKPLATFSSGKNPL